MLGKGNQLVLEHDGRLRPVGILMLFLAGFATAHLYRLFSPRPYTVPPVAALQCFEGFQAGYIPGDASIDAALAQLRRDKPSLVSRDHEQGLIRTLKAAESRCAKGDCPPDFLWHRLMLIEEMDRLAGLAGARFAAARLRTPEDVAVLRTFNEIRHNGHYSENTRRDLLVTYEIVLRGRIEQLVPCGRVTQQRV
jgi:hypothetical protein